MFTIIRQGVHLYFHSITKGQCTHPTEKLFPLIHGIMKPIKFILNNRVKPDLSQTPILTDWCPKLTCRPPHLD